MEIENQYLLIEKVIDNFLFYCRYEKNLTDKTLHAYCTDLLQFAAYMRNRVQKVNIEDLTKDDLKGYLQEISGFKPKTIKRKIASLKAMFNFLEYELDDFSNPLRKIKIRFKEPATLPTVMNIQEIKKILHTVYQSKEACQQGTYRFKSIVRDIAVLELLFATGIRVSELCQLKSQEVDLQYGRIKVFGKGSKERVIQICQPEVIGILKIYGKLFKSEIQLQSFFFINRLGYPLSSQSVRLMVKEYARKAGLTKHITPHTFRHTFATLLLEEDVDIKYIQNLLGHSTISTTQIYTHVNSMKQKKLLSAKHPRRKLSFS